MKFFSNLIAKPRKKIKAPEDGHIEHLAKKKVKNRAANKLARKMRKK